MNRRLVGREATGSLVVPPAWKSSSTFSCVSTARWQLRRNIIVSRPSSPSLPTARLVPCARYGVHTRRRVKSTSAADSAPPAVLYDQYYTQDNVAAALFDEVVKRYDPRLYQMLEPSAGTGAFFRLMPPGSLGVDIDPKGPGIVEADFLERRVESGRPVATIGNPPFGTTSSMAVNFFAHAATMSDVIAFVLPRTFRKRSLQNRLNENFHLVHEQIVPADAFLFMGKPYNVPAVFQIWERRDVARAPHVIETSHPDFAFTTRDEADFAIQRVGARAGRIHHDFERSANAHYFVRVADRSTRAIDRIQRIMRKLDFAAAAQNVAGNPSLAKSEIVALYTAFVTRQLYRKTRWRILLR
ncbi:SAM-dependent methyltransferase [Novosphingobium sediminis]|uniref:SAM-dependent methyltransferase n=1 Tax=Novosphingobium sediminis TaxID=707214 RepID=UPI001FE365C5|nr:SAM-dependent methyltransferase [Novosphingobium sediminis]